MLRLRSPCLASCRGVLGVPGVLKTLLASRAIPHLPEEFLPSSILGTCDQSRHTSSDPFLHGGVGGQARASWSETLGSRCYRGSSPVKQQTFPSVMASLSTAASLKASHFSQLGMRTPNPDKTSDLCFKTSGANQVLPLKHQPSLVSSRPRLISTRMCSLPQPAATWDSATASESAKAHDETKGTSLQGNLSPAVNRVNGSAALSQGLPNGSHVAAGQSVREMTSAALAAEEDPTSTADGTSLAAASECTEAGDSLLESVETSSADVSQSNQQEASSPDEVRPAGTPRRRRLRRPDLLLVPGVGPRTLLKLRASGIEEVAALTKVYREKRVRTNGMEAMVEYLRRDVGVRKDHATLISTFVKHKVEQEEDSSNEDRKAAKTKRLTFCVEGNISVGKSTFLRRVAGELLKLHEFVEVVPEPIEQWQDVGDSHLNLLQEFYDDPRKYAYTFQNYVFVTRVMQSLHTREGRQPLRLMERSIFSDRMVFVRAVHEAKWLDDVQLSVYDSSFDPFVRELPGLVPDGFIYLRAEPSTCYERLQRRARQEETKVSFEYLDNLHRKHDSWLIPPDLNPLVFPTLRHGEGGLLMNGQGERNLLVDEKWPGDATVPQRLKNKVYGLRGADVHPSIQNVPALVLDCNSHIDFNIPPEEINWYADDILAFFDFVKSMKEGAPAESQPGSQLIMPHQCMGEYQNLVNSLQAAA